MKAALSFFSLFIGWCVAIISNVCLQVFGPGFGYVTDFNFFLIWTALFALLGWFILMLPAIYLVRCESPAMQFPAFMLTGSFYCVLVYMVLVGTWLPDAWRLAWFPAVMGGVGGGVYSLMMRSGWLDRRRGYLAAALFLAPFVMLLSFTFAVWPLVVRHLPYVAYVFGAGQSRDAAHLQILKRIHKGQTYAELNRRYPRIFTQPMLATSADHIRFRYRIVFDKTRTYIEVIEITEKP